MEPVGKHRLPRFGQSRDEQDWPAPEGVPGAAPRVGQPRPTGCAGRGWPAERALFSVQAGGLAEHAPPHLLLNDPVSLFSKLVDDTGSAADHLRKLAREAHEARATGAM